ncbi:aminoacyl-tRNA hydrolase [Campylobacter corcagiensis]|uniref:Peptidyl-tRNA hydrolase n=1 Tax=Campylobacter corcagiensis TaxID=1448857 RepID=A0A7M1LIP5_9BACT|nr:aminoacyl-tRNA hydrolase [Campylobacter corcagiensis]QOQ87726.1 aminoacyl-tRNA hydrolase [Campylobacter corcagiensis]
MTLVVGLGNPGSEYENTRHNIGFMLIDRLKNSNFSDVSSAKFQGELYKNGSLLLLKPTTFMNLSGNSVKAVNDFYKPERIIVIHDDLDLNLGAIRFKFGGSSGGHNGIKSIDSLIGNGYERVRIGIGKKGGAVGHVLGKFTNDESIYLEKILSYAKEATLALINGEMDDIKARYSTKEVK